MPKELLMENDKLKLEFMDNGDLIINLKSHELREKLKAWFGKDYEEGDDPMAMFDSIFDDFWKGGWVEIPVVFHGKDSYIFFVPETQAKLEKVPDRFSPTRYCEGFIAESAYCDETILGSLAKQGFVRLTKQSLYWRMEEWKKWKVENNLE